MVKAGEIAVLKTSNEMVYVIGITGDLATVRRPVGTEQGVKHLVEDFYTAELETQEERLDRELAERGMLKKKMGLNGEESGAFQLN